MKYMGSEGGSDHGEHKKIDWNDFNYPCCLKLFHFDADETPPHLKKQERLLRINHVLIIFTCLWNLVNNIVNTAYGYLLPHPASTSPAYASPSQSSRPCSGSPSASTSS